MLLTAATALLGGCANDEPTAKNLVLITLDTTRRDALTCLGGPEGITPNLDALAAESTLYLDAYTVAPLTLPSHTSMLTGLYPLRHTVRDNSLTPVPAGAVTLAEKAGDKGMATGAVVAAAVLSEIYGLDQGFDDYDEPARQGHGFAPRPAEEVTERAASWLAGRNTDERYFLWAHYFDPHKPYSPGPEFLARAGGNAYLGSVARMDAGVGELLDLLRARDDWEDTLVIVVADHGEGLGEHGEDTHSAFVYDTTIRVPMLIRFPGGAGSRSEAMVSVADVFPTAVDLLGLGTAGDIDGVSLRSAPADDRGVYFESYYGHIYHQWSPAAGWADRHAKYIHSSEPELYRTDADPGESANLLNASDVDVGGYIEAMRELAGRPALEVAEGTIDRSMIAALQDLGYAGAGGLDELPGPLDLASELPSPHARAEELGWIVASWNLASRDQLDEAVRVLERVVRSNPKDHGSWSRLGRLLMRRGDHAGAAEAFEHFAAIGPPWPEDYLSLGLCYRILERDEDAITWLRQGLALDPKNIQALEVLFDLFQELKRDEEAMEVYEQLEAAR